MNASLPVVSSMTPDDLAEVMFLERRCFTDPWTRRMYLNDLTTNETATYLIIRHGDGATGRHGDGQAGEANIAVSSTLPVPASPILAYGGFWLLMDEAHIATIATHPDWRGCGLGERLMLALLDAAVSRGAKRSTLEVRRGNVPAQRLYQKLGYEIVGARRHYYRDGEDGLIMTSPALTDPAMRQRLEAVQADALARWERCVGGRSTMDNGR